MVTKADVEKYVAEVQKRTDHTYLEHPAADPKISFTEGKRFFKVAVTTWGQTSVHSFVDKENGDVLKPASWDRPALHARGNILSEYHGAEALSDYGVRYLR